MFNVKPETLPSIVPALTHALSFLNCSRCVNLCIPISFCLTVFSRDGPWDEVKCRHLFSAEAESTRPMCQQLISRSI
jgi:hypothetical protein